MKHLLIVALTASALSIPACGDEVAVSFGSLSGSYQLNDNCFIHVSGSKGQASCAWSDNPEVPEQKWEGILEFKLSENKISGTLYASKQDRWCDWSGDECDPWTACTYTISGEATKTAGRSTTGMFSALAGSWTSQVDIRESCRYDASIDADTTETIVIATPEIGGNAATITFNVYRDGALSPSSPQETFSVTAEDGGLAVDGEWIRKL
jgi:hypothetical protein